MKTLLLFLGFSAMAFAQPCGRMATNPRTHLRDCIGPAGAGTGTVTSAVIAGTANQITVTGTCTITTSGTCTLSLPSNMLLPGTLTTGSGTTAGGAAVLGNATGDTAASYLEANSGDGASNTEPAYLKLWSSHSTKRKAALFACTNADGFLCIATGTPVADASNPIATKTGSTTTNNCAKWDASGNLVDAGAACSTGGTPGTPTGSLQKNVASAFAGQANIFGGGSVLTSAQYGNEFANVTLTQGGNLTLPAQTTAYSVTLATSVSCNTFFSGSVISITTAFSGGTGGLWGQFFHGSVAIGPLVDLTQTAGTFVPDVPGMGCVGAATNDIKVTFTGDASHNLSGYSAGSVKVKVIGSATE